MCGIAGLYSLTAEAANPRRLMKASQLISHRGPDSEGYLLLNTDTGACELRNGVDTEPRITYPMVDAPAPFPPDLIFLHRRLAIIDPSPAGHEPMRLAGRDDLWITFNGELYNYLEVRAELQAKGRIFTTECDVEVLLHAYDEWGVDCLNRFMGMFAFALWDQNKQRLWLARDRFGIKPLYYAASPSQFSFASELKAFQSLDPAACQPNIEQVYWSLQYNAIFNPPQTFLKGVCELPGGCFLLVENGIVKTPERWYSLALDQTSPIPDSQSAAEAFLDLMRDSVRLHLRSDVPVGTCLSGGLDSSTIVALATDLLDGGSMNSFSVVYPVKGYDESRFVEIVADRYRTIKHVATPAAGRDYVDQLSSMVWHQDVPVTGTGLISQNTVMRLAQGQVKVLLDGQGSDELMAGYLSHAVFYYRHLLRANPGLWASNFPTFVMQVWQRYLPGFSFREFVSRTGHTLVHGRASQRFLSPEAEQIARQSETRRIPGELPGADALNNHLYQAVTCTSIPALLHYEDRSSMTYGIEARVPYLDHRLVEYVLRIPETLKIRGAEGKHIMRRAVSGILPTEVANRKDKLGYPTPFATWSRTTLRGEISAYLEDVIFKREGYDTGRLRSIWQQHLAGVINADRLIHNLITTELWYSHFGKPQ